MDSSRTAPQRGVLARAMMVGSAFCLALGFGVLDVALEREPGLVSAAWPEPNNVPDDASHIEKERFGFQWTDHLCPSGDVDYYHFDVKQGEEYTIDLWHLPADLDFRVYGQALQEIGSSTNSGTQAEQFTFMPPLHTTEVWVKIYGFNGAAGCENPEYYLFKVSSTESDPCLPDAQEPNDDRASTSPMGSSSTTYRRTGTICEGDEDWFQFVVSPGWTLDAELQVPTDYDLKLYSGDGVVLADSTRSNTETERISHTFQNGGPKYVLVEPYNNASSSRPYELELALTGAPACTDAHEPNDTLAEAHFVASQLNRYSREGKICRGDVDFYEITVEAGWSMEAILDRLPADFDINLRDSAGNMIKDSRNYDTDPELIEYEFPDAGDYYLYVYGAGGAFDEFQTYRLIVDLSENSSCGEGFEPNETRQTAATLVLEVPIAGFICVPGDEDWFSTGLLQGGSIEVTLSSLPADYDLHIYDDSGTELAKSNGGGTADERIDFTAPTDGAYHIRVSGYNGASSNTDGYVLQANHTIASCNEAFEPNESADASHTLALPSTTSGYICDAADEDWFAFEVPFGSTAVVRLWDLPQNYDLEVFQDLGGQLAPALVERSERAGLAEESVSVSWNTLSSRFLARVYGPGGNASNTEGYQLTLAAAAIPTSTPDICSEPFGFEPNESRAEAAAIQANWAYAPLRLCSASEEDWFSLDLEAGRRLDVFVELLPANYEMAIYDQQGSLLHLSTNPATTTETGSVTVATAQSVFIRVFGAEGAFSIDRGYRLRTSLAEAPTPTPTPDPGCGDAFEPNEDLASAAPIISGRTQRGHICDDSDEDWFSIEATAGQYLDLSLDGLAVDLDVELFSPSGGDPLRSQAGGTTPESLRVESTEAGRYGIRVFGYGGVFSASDDYALRVELGMRPTCGDGFEPNETHLEAAPIVEGLGLLAYLCVAGDEDWLSISTADGETLRATLDQLPADYDLALHDASGAFLTRSDRQGQDSESIEHLVSGGGTYFLRVYGYQGAHSALQPYRLLASSDAPGVVPTAPPPPSPTFTPVPKPSATPSPTSPPKPSRTPTATQTRVPKATSTATATSEKPTSAPRASSTPSPTATATASPTLEPTSTSVPSSTPRPKPTSTPTELPAKPTGTPTPTQATATATPPAPATAGTPTPSSVPTESRPTPATPATEPPPDTPVTPPDEGPIYLPMTWHGV